MTGRAGMGGGCVQTGRKLETVLQTIAKQHSANSSRGLRISDQRAHKVILNNDRHIHPGKPCRAGLRPVKMPACRMPGLPITSTQIRDHQNNAIASLCNGLSVCGQ